jgi:8-oxo-dGTP diphosphatase
MSVGEYPDVPRVAVGAIVFKAGRVLLVKRGRPPSQGQWAIPGGRVELGETLQAAAEREINEETGLIIRARDPAYTFDVILRDDAGRVRFHYVIVDLLADYLDGGEPRPGDDAREARWVAPQDLAELPVSQTILDVLKNVFHFSPSI